MDIGLLKIGVVIPWREHPTRMRAFHFVLEWYRRHLPNATIYLCDNGNEVWEPSATRNLGVRKAQTDSCDIIIMNDADTIPNIRPLTESIKAAHGDHMIHNPYHEYAYIELEHTHLFFDEDVPLDSLPYQIIDSCAGTMVFKPAAWWMLGGSDEKFIKWGYEDTAQQLVHDVIHGCRFVKHFGTIYAFAHQQQDSWANPSKYLIYNKDLYNLYYDIYIKRDKAAILELAHRKKASWNVLYN